MPSNGSNKILWFFTTTLTLIVLSLAGGWAMESRSIDAKTESRVLILEQQYAEINGKLDTLLRLNGAGPKEKK